MKIQKFLVGHVNIDTRMVRPGLLLVALAISVSVQAQEEPAGKGAVEPETTEQALNAHYTRAELERGVYVGSELCLECHDSYKPWSESKHATSIRHPMPRYSLVPGKGVVADHDRNGVDDFVQGLDFNLISSVFDPFKPHAPVLSVTGEQYFITLGEVKMPVVFVVGGTGDWRERYGVRIPVTDSRTGYSDEVYTSPVQFNEDSKTFFAYKISNWYGATKRPLVTPGTTRAAISELVKLSSFSKNCVGCHVTGIRSVGQTPNGEWLLRPYPAIKFETEDPAYFDYDGDGRKDLMNIGCEMCHGPGSAHLSDPHDPKKIVNPAKLDAAQANQVCGRCHDRVRSVPGKTFGYAYHDDTGTQWTPGREPLASFTADNNSNWPDGETSYEHNQHYSEMNRSAHAKLRCSDCHDPHAQMNPAQIVAHRTVGGIAIATRSEDNTLCLSCHATKEPFEDITPQMVAKYAENLTAIGTVVSAHTHHPYAPERTLGLSRCTSCHMPAVAAAEHESPLHTHQVKVVPPGKTLRYQKQGGMPNACAVCHGSRIDLWGYGIDANPVVWNELTDLKNATKLMEYFGPEGKWWKEAIQEPGVDAGK